MLPNYDTQGIGMHHIYFVCPITEPCVRPRANRKGYTSMYVTDWYMPVGYECIRPGAVSRWHNDDPVWSIQCNNRVPSVANAGLMIHDCVGNYMYFASLRTCTEWQVPDWLSWGNVGSRRLQQTSVLRESDLIGHRSAGGADEVASCLARWVVRGMSTRTDVLSDRRTVNVNRRREWILLLRDEIGKL